MAISETKMDYASVLTQTQTEIETDRACRNARESRFALYCSLMLIVGFLLGALLGQMFGAAHAQSLTSLERRAVAPSASGALALRKSLVTRSRKMPGKGPSILKEGPTTHLASFRLPMHLTLREAPHRQLPVISTPPAWIKNSSPSAVPFLTPVIALIIDDLGPVKRATERALRLPAAVTLSFLPSAPGVDDFARRARAGGHEILIHMPMEPEGPAHPGSHALKVSQSAADIKRELSWAFSRLSGYVGINNHMGSRFSHNRAGMDVALKHINSAGLLYLDSRTSGSSLAPAIAKSLDLPFAVRDVFLDDETDASTILTRLIETEASARRTGSAIAIAHPRDHSLDTLEVWLETIEERGLGIVPLTAVVRKRQSGQLRVAAAN